MFIFINEPNVKNVDDDTYTLTLSVCVNVSIANIKTNYIK